MSAARLAERYAPWILLVPCLLHAETVFDPPYWDALTGSVPQGLWLARHGLDPSALLREKSYGQGGPRVYPCSVYPWLVALLYRAWLSPRTVFAVLHLVSIGAAWAALCAFQRIARRHLEPAAALLAALVLGTLPLFASLTAQINMDMPLVCATLLAFEALCARRGWRSFLASAVALHLKTTGILAVATAVVVFGARAWRARRHRDRSLIAAETGTRPGAWMLAHLGLLVIGVVEARVSAGAGTAGANVRLFAGFVPLVRDIMWFVPEYAFLLVAFALSLPLWWARERRSPANDGSRAAFVFVLITLVFFAQYTNTLARYLLQSLPFLLLWFVVLLERVVSRPRVVAGALALCTGLNLVNEKGVLYGKEPGVWSLPGESTPLLANDGHFLERSMRYRDDLVLCLATARRAEVWADRGYVLVAAWPIAHVLGIPELGYTERHLPVAVPMTALTYDEDEVPYESLYSGGLTFQARRKVDRPIVWVISPSGIASGRLGLWPGDEILEQVEYHGHRTLFVRRRAWE